LRARARATASAAGAPGARSAPAPAAGVTLAQALRERRFWSLNVAWSLLGGTIFMFSVHAVPFARDQGLALSIAALGLTTYGFGSVIGRLVTGVVSDRFGTRVTTRAGYVVELAALVTLAVVPAPSVLLIAMGLFGVGAGATDNVLVRAIPDQFGLRALGAITGALTLGWRCGAAIGPAAAGFLYDLTGSYALAFRAAPVAVVVSWTLFTIATSRRPVE
jgi:MFS family permease